MRNRVLTLGIWAVAALVLALLWSTAPNTSSAPAGAALSPATPHNDAERGRALFMAKGCARCHYHAATTTGFNEPHIGPDLTRYQPNPEFVQRWLRNPQAVRLNTQMPNLNLAQDEIDALIAFLSVDEQRP
ncbi:MAG TPA: c-type cytochrome [Herpetosiphonaceae bacterium]